MRRLISFFLVAVTLAACSSTTHRVAAPKPATTTTVTMPSGVPVARVSDVAAQTVAGFGASGAWWPNDLVSFPDDAQRLVEAMLFGKNGLQLSGYRYYIGAGGKGVTTPARAEKALADDAAGLRYLRAASDAHVEALTGFVYAAPQFSTNGKACGGSLKPGDETAYAQYIAGLVKRIHDEQHVTLQYVSPMNEPDDSFPDCGQEGMAVPVGQRAAVVQALGKALAREAPYTKVIADETTADSILANEAPQWLSVPGTAQYVAAIAHHTYDFPNDAIRKLVPPVAARFDKPTWMTEICCYKGSGGVASSFGAGYDPTMTQGLWLADQIYDDFTVAGDNAWYWWTALSPELGCDPKTDPVCVAETNTKGFNDGLLYYDANGGKDGVTTIFPTRRFYVLGQFSRYVRPGAQRHAVSGLPRGVRAMTFEHDGEWTVVAWNEGVSTSRFALALPKPSSTVVRAITTSGADALIPVFRTPPARTTNGTWLVTIAPQAIVTMSFR